MEITNEIKSKVFAPYLGVAWVRYNNPYTEGMRAGILSGHDLQRIEHHKEPFAVIILKPISEISEDDANEIVKISGGFPYRIESKHFEVKSMDSLYLSECVYITQFLQSKGYDMPQYLLGGKTLKEVGLAVYYK